MTLKKKGIVDIERGSTRSPFMEELDVEESVELSPGRLQNEGMNLLIR